MELPSLQDIYRCFTKDSYNSEEYINNGCKLIILPIYLKIYPCNCNKSSDIGSITSIKISDDGTLVVFGTSTGIVNIYNMYNIWQTYILNEIELYNKFLKLGISNEKLSSITDIDTIVTESTKSIDTISIYDNDIYKASNTYLYKLLQNPIEVDTTIKKNIYLPIINILYIKRWNILVRTILYELDKNIEVSSLKKYTTISNSPSYQYITNKELQNFVIVPKVPTFITKVKDSSIITSLYIIENIFFLSYYQLIITTNKKIYIYELQNTYCIPQHVIDKQYLHREYIKYLNTIKTPKNAAESTLQKKYLVDVQHTKQNLGYDVFTAPLHAAKDACDSKHLDIKKNQLNTVTPVKKQRIDYSEASEFDIIEDLGLEDILNFDMSDVTATATVKTPYNENKLEYIDTTYEQKSESVIDTNKNSFDTATTTTTIDRMNTVSGTFLTRCSSATNNNSNSMKDDIVINNNNNNNSNNKTTHRCTQYKYHTLNIPKQSQSTLSNTYICVLDISYKIDIKTHKYLLQIGTVNSNILVSELNAINKQWIYNYSINVPSYGKIQNTILHLSPCTTNDIWYKLLINNNDGSNKIQLKTNQDSEYGFFSLSSNGYIDLWYTMELHSFTKPIKRWNLSSFTWVDTTCYISNNNNNNNIINLQDLKFIPGTMKRYLLGQLYDDSIIAIDLIYRSIYYLRYSTTIRQNIQRYIYNIIDTFSFQLQYIPKLYTFSQEIIHFTIFYTILQILQLAPIQKKDCNIYIRGIYCNMQDSLLSISYIKYLQSYIEDIIQDLESSLKSPPSLSTSLTPPTSSHVNTLLLSKLLQMYQTDILTSLTVYQYLLSLLRMSKCIYDKIQDIIIRCNTNISSSSSINDATTIKNISIINNKKYPVQRTKRSILNFITNLPKYSTIDNKYPYFCIYNNNNDTKGTIAVISLQNYITNVWSDQIDCIIHESNSTIENENRYIKKDINEIYIKDIFYKKNTIDTSKYSITTKNSAKLKNNLITFFTKLPQQYIQRFYYRYNIVYPHDKIFTLLLYSFITFQYTIYGNSSIKYLQFPTIIDTISTNNTPLPSLLNEVNFSNTNNDTTSTQTIVQRINGREYNVDVNEIDINFQYQQSITRRIRQKRILQRENEQQNISSSMQDDTTTSIDSYSNTTRPITINDTILPDMADSFITTLAIHPKLPIIIVGFSNGTIRVIKIINSYECMYHDSDINR